MLFLKIIATTRFHINVKYTNNKQEVQCNNKRLAVKIFRLHLYDAKGNLSRNKWKVFSD